MAKGWQKRSSGVVVPVDEQAAELPPKPTERQEFIQHELLDSQLPKYLHGLVEDGAEILVVFRSPGVFMGGRYSVAYRHTERLECEIYT